jgi:hypothetical protein
MEIMLKDLSPGQDYTIQLRAKNQSGSSAWSRSYKIRTTSDIIAPAPVTSLVWAVSGTSFIGTWTKPTLDSNGLELKDFRDYKITLTAGIQSVVYYVTQERFDLTFEANSAAFTNPEPEVTIKVEVRDVVGNISTSVSATASNPVPPNVSNFNATAQPNSISLQWDSVAVEDLKQYEVHMSTAGSGFSPTSGNLVFSGLSTAFLFPSSNQVIHYFKIRAVDIYGQGSLAYAVDSAIPDLPTGLDTAPPDDPTSVVVSSTAGEAGESQLTVTWAAVTSPNLRYYVVRWSTDEVTWQFINVPADKTSTIISGLKSSTDYYVAVASVSQVNSISDYINATPYPITAALDATPPSRPAPASVAVGPLMAVVGHDMTKNSGGNLESDVAYLEVHASITMGFTTSIATLRGTIQSAGDGIPVQGAFTFTDLSTTPGSVYWRVIAVDTSENKSIGSFEVTGTPGLLSGVNIIDASILNAKIGNLSAAKLIAGTAIVNDLYVRSGLTLDDINGYVQTSDFNAGTKTGWKLDKQGITLYDGIVAAKALDIQDSANIAPPQFADFEFDSDFYHDGANLANDQQLTASAGMNLVIQSASFKTGNQALRLHNGAITPPTRHRLVLSRDGLTNVDMNVNVDPGDYIFSVWAKSNGAIDQEIAFGVYTDASGTITSAVSSVTSSAFTRYSKKIAIPSGVSRIKLFLEVGPMPSEVGYDIIIDAIQFERKIGASDSPSAWTSPSRTTIDGGSIITGSIRSSAPSATVPTEPAWSLNTTGGMQVGDALVRGTLVVGNPLSYINLVPDSYSTLEMPESFYNDGAGLANPNNIFIDDSCVVQIQNSGAMFGTQALRIQNSTRNAANPIGLFMGGINGIGNIALKPSTTYILSAYVKSGNVAKNQEAGVGVLANDGNWYIGLAGDRQAITSTSYTRVYRSFTTTPSITAAQFAFYLAPTGVDIGFDMIVDGIMVEEAAVGQTTPSTFSLNGDSTSYVKSAGYQEGMTGWLINSDGSVEFNNGLFRGSLDISQTVGGYTYNMNLQNRTSRFQYRQDGEIALVSDTNIYGTNPTMRYTGYAQQWVKGADGNLVLDRNSQVQAATRLTPAGQYQIIFDPTNTEDIYDVDGNSLYTVDGTRKNINYSFANSFWGTRRAGTGQSRRANIEHTTRSFMENTQPGAVQPKLRSYATFLQESSAETGLWYDIMNKTSSASGGTNSFISGNKIKDNFDIFDHASGLSYYSTNCIQNRFTFTSIQTNTFAAGRRNLNSLKLTIASGTGNPTIYFATSGVYDTEVVPGQYNIVAGWFATSQANLQVRGLIKTSDGTVYPGDWQYINKTATLIGGQLVNHPYAYGYSASISVPDAAPDDAQIGFEFQTGTNGQTVNITAVTYADATSDVDRLRFSEVGRTETYSGVATFLSTFEPYPEFYEYVAATAGPQSDAGGWDPYIAHQRVKTEQIVEFLDSSGYGIKKVALSRLGWREGEIQDPHQPNGISQGKTGVLGQLASNVKVGIFALDFLAMHPSSSPNGTVYLNYNENGDVITGPSAITGLEIDWPASIYYARRGGIYLCSAAMKVAKDEGEIVFLELWKLAPGVNPPSTGQLISRLQFPLEDQYGNLTMPVDATPGDRFYFTLGSETLAANRDISDIKLNFVQIL